MSRPEDTKERLKFAAAQLRYQNRGEDGDPGMDYLLDLAVKGVAAEGIAPERHAEICEAERDGRCVVLPCKVGEIAYELCIGCGAKSCRDCAGDGHCVEQGWHIEKHKTSLSFWEQRLPQLGKTVFLTRAEAEAASKAVLTPATPPHEHKKVYSNRVLTSYPAQREWICEICGETGIDREPQSTSPSYDKIIEKFKADAQKGVNTQ